MNSHKQSANTCKGFDVMPKTPILYCRRSILGRSAGDASPIWNYCRLLVIFKSIFSSAEDLDEPDNRVVFATENNSTFLECIPRSPQATVTWLVQRDDRKEEVRRFPVCLRRWFQNCCSQSRVRESESSNSGLMKHIRKRACEFGTWLTHWTAMNHVV